MKTTRIDSPETNSRDIFREAIWLLMEAFHTLNLSIAPHASEEKVAMLLGTVESLFWEPTSPPPSHPDVKVGTRWGVVIEFRADGRMHRCDGGVVFNPVPIEDMIWANWIRLPDPEGWRERCGCRVSKNSIGWFVVAKVENAKWFLSTDRRWVIYEVGEPVYFSDETSARLALANCPTPPAGEKETTCKSGRESSDSSGAMNTPPSEATHTKTGIPSQEPAAIAAAVLSDLVAPAPATSKLRSAEEVRVDVQSCYREVVTDQTGAGIIRADRVEVLREIEKRWYGGTFDTMHDLITAMISEIKSL